MLISFPPPPSGFSASYLGQVLDTIRRSFTSLVATDEGVNHIILLSPNGTAYNVTVSNAGALVVTQNSGNTPP